jgi:hypothetical protein
MDIFCQKFVDIETFMLNICSELIFDTMINSDMTWIIVVNYKFLLRFLQWACAYEKDTFVPSKRLADISYQMNHTWLYCMKQENWRVNQDALRWNTNGHTLLPKLKEFHGNSFQTWSFFRIIQNSCSNIYLWNFCLVLMRETAAPCTQYYTLISYFLMLCFSHSASSFSNN